MSVGALSFGEALDSGQLILALQKFHSEAEITRDHQVMYPESDIIFESTVVKMRSLASVIVAIRTLRSRRNRSPSLTQSYRDFENKVSYFVFIDGDEIETAPSPTAEITKRFFPSIKDYLVSREYYGRVKKSLSALQRAHRDGKLIFRFRHCVPHPYSESIAYRIVTLEYPVDVIRQALYKKYVERYITRTTEDLDLYGKTRRITLDKALNYRCRQQVYYAFTRGATIDTDGVVTYPVKVDGKLILRTSPLSEIFFELRYLSCSDSHDHRIPFLQNAMRRATMYKAGLKSLGNI